MKTNNIQLLVWDTNFFNMKIGRVDVVDESAFDFSFIKNRSKEEGYELLYIFSKTPVKTHFEKPINTKIGFKMAITPNLKSSFSDKVKIYTGKKIKPILQKLAYQAGHFSRFKLDSNLSPSAFYKLYDQWLAKSLADDIMIIEYIDNNQVAGMVTLEIKKSSTLIGLIGVDNSFRGKGIGKHLVKSCIYHSQIQQKAYLEVYTQKENVQATKFYESCGFELANLSYIYHYWAY